jgi:EAL domain-containing protein (putative c-di-GMP-specific phosphodiesterase class I)
MLGEFGAEAAQGYLLGRPLPAPEFEDRLGQHKVARRRLGSSPA